MAKEKHKILLTEDDKNLGSVLKSYLEAKGYATTLATNGEEALKCYSQDKFDICLLDVMMPVMDGFTLAKNIREKDMSTPIIFLTAKTMQEDILDGFSLGADDYITKPFSMEELLARVEAVLRRAKNTSISKEEEGIYNIGKYRFDYKRQTLRINDRDQRLTTRESDLLQLLCINMNEVLDRSDALKKIWNDDSYFNARSMDVYVAKLRKYLKADPTVEIMNVHGIGFRLLTE